VLKECHEGAQASALAACLRERRPDLVLAGTRAGFWQGTGLLPYELADLLQWPMIPDLVAARREPERWSLAQYRPRGARRNLLVDRTWIGTVGPGAPAARQSAFARARAGTIGVIAADTTASSAAPTITHGTWIARASRTRAAMTTMRGGAAEDRRRALFGASGAQRRMLTGASPDEIATLVLHKLRELGLR
jgi:electron transfer flavoprotein beta subunit